MVKTNVNSERLNNFLKDKKEIVIGGLSNLDAMLRLSCLSNDSKNNFSARIRSYKGDVFWSKKLCFRGYDDDFYSQARNVDGPSIVDIFVSRDGQIIETISVRNRK